MKRCKRCDKSYLSELFCPHCGDELITYPRCQHCDRELHPFDKFCGFCGRPVQDDGGDYGVNTAGV